MRHILINYFLMKRDQQIFDLIQQEKERQLRGIELIASENFVSPEVMEAAPYLPISMLKDTLESATMVDAK